MVKNTFSAAIQRIVLLQLAAVTEERDNLREDLRGHKDSKRTVDRSWRVERERAETLERELGFYQSQSARAMADRDQACSLLKRFTF